MARPTRRDDILDAAERVVRRDGVVHLTLDAAAAEAGTSKGGLLYHFATRDALVTAMVDRLTASFEASLAAHVEADAEPRGRWTRAYIRTTAAIEGPSAEDATASALLAAVAAGPALVEPLRGRYAAWRARVADDGLPMADAMVAALAADGLWMADLLGFAAPAGDARAAVIARILQLAEPTA